MNSIEIKHLTKSFGDIKAVDDLSFSVEKGTFFKRNPEWYYYDENDYPHLTEKAPPEAVESYEYWKKMYERSQKEGIIFY